MVGVIIYYKGTRTLDLGVITELIIYMEVFEVDPLRRPVPFWGQTRQIPTKVSPIVPETRLQS